MGLIGNGAKGASNPDQLGKITRDECICLKATCYGTSG